MSLPIWPPQGQAPPGVATTRDSGVVEVSQSPFTGDPVAITTADPVWQRLLQEVADLWAQARMQQKNPGTIGSHFATPTDVGPGTTAAVNPTAQSLGLGVTLDGGSAINVGLPGWDGDFFAVALAVAPSTWHVCWSSTLSNNTQVLLYNQWLAAGAWQWGTPWTLSLGPGVQSLDCTVDGAGTGHVVWSDNTGRLAYTQTPLGSPPQSATYVTAAPPSGAYLVFGSASYTSGIVQRTPWSGTSIGVDGNGGIHVVGAVGSGVGGNFFYLTWLSGTSPGSPQLFAAMDSIYDAYAFLAVNPAGVVSVVTAAMAAAGASAPAVGLFGNTGPNGMLTVQPLTALPAWNDLLLAPLVGSPLAWYLGNTSSAHLRGLPFGVASYVLSTVLATVAAGITSPMGAAAAALGPLTYVLTSDGGTWTLWTVTAVTSAVASAVNAPLAANGPVGGLGVTAGGNLQAWVGGSDGSVYLQTLTASPALSGVYQRRPVTLPTPASSATAWVDRAVTVSTTLTQNVAAGATTLDVTSAQDLADGDTLELDPGTSVGERVIISSISSTTITLTTGTLYAHTAPGTVNRVDVLPSISLVAAGSAPSYSAMTWQSTAPYVSVPGAWEDTYTYSQASAEPEFSIRLALSANSANVAPAVAVYQYGVALGVG